MLPDELAKQWHTLARALPERVSIVRRLASYQEPLEAVELHVFYVFCMSPFFLCEYMLFTGQEVEQLASTAWLLVSI